MPCNNCSACMMNDCGVCKFCLDKRKFGGPGKLKKRCELRTCVTPSAAKTPGSENRVKMTTIRNVKTLTIRQKQPEMRNKFLSSVDLDECDMNSSFEDSFGFGAARMSDDSPSPPEPSGASLQSYIIGGLGGDGDAGERYEVVEVIQAEDKPCYICKAFTNEDLFYCSSCYDPYHQFCLQMQHLPQHKGLNGSGSMCGRCLNSKDSYEEDMNNRAKSIDNKCEEINGKQYQVISFLSDPDHEDEKLDQDLNLDAMDPWESLGMSSVPSFGFNSLNDLPGSYDVDFDKYLQTNGLALSIGE